MILYPVRRLAYARSSLHEVFSQITVSKNFINFTGKKVPAPESFFLDKVEGLRPATLE